jgi:hypothetical protein
MTSMSASKLETLPEVLPVFPLTGSLLLPGNYMPLNIFEPRYGRMVEDVQAGSPYIGMVQPVVPRNDNALDPLTVADDPELYAVGCAGRLERCEAQEDGRYLVLLRGICRFRSRGELPTERGYRRVRADYSEFSDDLGETEVVLDPDPLLGALREFATRRRMEFDLERLQALPGVALLNGLSVALPFSPGEKQALLEAEGPRGRRDLLLALMGMGFAPGMAEDDPAPPRVH